MGKDNRSSFEKQAEVARRMRELEEAAKRAAIVLRKGPQPRPETRPSVDFKVTFNDPDNDK
jgi:hypothetical protein